VNIKKLKADWDAGKTIQDIIEKHKITKSQLMYQVKKNNWKRREKSGGKCNEMKKGNQNAVVTGAYAKIYKDCFDEEELELFNEPVRTKQEELEEEIRILRIRELRIMKKIKELKDKNKDLIITEMSKYITTSTKAESVILLIDRLENSLTKVQEAKRRAIDSLHKIKIENDRLDFDKSIKGDIAESITDRITIINNLPPAEEVDSDE